MVQISVLCSLTQTLCRTEACIVQVSKDLTQTNDCRQRAGLFVSEV